MNKAKILDGELKGTEFEISKETVQNIKKGLSNVPKYIIVGQTYRIGKLIYMVAAFGGKDNYDCNVGLTIVSGYDSGCYSSSILTGTLNYEQLRNKLIEKKAVYLGRFDDIFERKNND